MFANVLVFTARDLSPNNNAVAFQLEANIIVGFSVWSMNLKHKLARLAPESCAKLGPASAIASTKSPRISFSLTTIVPHSKGYYCEH